eukprot:g42063.t1
MSQEQQAEVIPPHSTQWKNEVQVYAAQLAELRGLFDCNALEWSWWNTISWDGCDRIKCYTTPGVHIRTDKAIPSLTLYYVFVAKTVDGLGKGIPISSQKFCIAIVLRAADDIEMASDSCVDMATVD